MKNFTDPYTFKIKIEVDNEDLMYFTDVNSLIDDNDRKWNK